VGNICWNSMPCTVTGWVFDRHADQYCIQELMWCARLSTILQVGYVLPEGNQIGQEFLMGLGEK